MSAPSSPASADSTTDSPELGFDTPSSVSRTLGGEPSSPITSPECRSTRTFETLVIDRNEDGTDYIQELPALRKVGNVDPSAASVLRVARISSSQPTPSRRPPEAAALAVGALGGHGCTVSPPGLLVRAETAGVRSPSGRDGTQLVVGCSD